MASYTEEMVPTDVRNGLADLRSGSEVAWAVAVDIETGQELWRFETEDFEITSLALQYCGLEPTAQLTIAEKKQVADTEKLMRLYLMRTDLDTRWTNAQQAAALGCSVATVKRWAAGGEFQRKRATLTRSAGMRWRGSGSRVFRWGRSTL